MSLLPAMASSRSASTVMGSVAWDLNVMENLKAGFSESDMVEGADSTRSTFGASAGSLRVWKRASVWLLHCSGGVFGGGSLPCRLKCSIILS